MNYNLTTTIIQINVKEGDRQHIRVNEYEGVGLTMESNTVTQ